MDEQELMKVDMQQVLQENEQKIQEMEQKVTELEQKGKKKKGWKKVLIVIGVFMTIFAVMFAVVVGMMLADKDSPAMAEQVLRAIVDGDSDGAYELMYPGLLDRETFVSEFSSICKVWREQGGEDTFTMKRQGWGVERKNGISQYTVNYKVTSGNAVFDMELVRAVQGDTAGMLGVHISVRLPERVAK